MAAKRGVIALVGETLKTERAAVWFKELQKAMPNEKVQMFSAADKENIEVAICGRLTTEIVPQLQSLSNLQFIQSIWAGVDSIVPVRGLDDYPLVRMVDRCMAEDMSCSVLMWTLYLYHQAPKLHAAQRRKEWNAELSIPVRFDEFRIGILGFGHLGKAACATLSKNGFPVSAWSRNPKDIGDTGARRTYYGPDGLENILSTSHVIINLLPLTTETRGLINGEKMDKMQKGAGIINVGRGPTIVAGDLVDRLTSNQLSHAVLDVFDVEPLPKDSPLWDHPNVTVLPHIAAVTNPRTGSATIAATIDTWRTTGRTPESGLVQRELGY